MSKIAGRIKSQISLPSSSQPILPIGTIFLFFLLLLPTSFTTRVPELTMGNGAIRTSQLELVNYLQRSHAFKNPLVRTALEMVDRADFAPSHPYEDRPQEINDFFTKYIGYGATISAPHMHAAALEHLVDVIGNNSSSRVLDVGSGSGYLAACFAKLVGPGGKVIGIEHIDQLVDLSIRNVRKNHRDLLDSGRLQFIAGDGRLGWPAEAPYQAIHVGAAASEIPKALIDQLALGGRMLIPVGTYNQKFLQVDKALNGEITQRRLADVIYVPLTSKSQQISRDESL